MTSTSTEPTTNPYALWFGRVTWLGIAVNTLFIFPLLLAPESLLRLLSLQVPDPIIWVRCAGLLLLEISILYIPGAIDPYRYRVSAWMSVLVTRGGGSSFFLIAVLFFRQSIGFLSIAIVDLVFGIVEGVLLWKALRSES